MKLKTKWFLFIFSLLLVYTAISNTRCNELGDKDPTILMHQSGLPYYDSIQIADIDSVVGEMYNGEYMEIVYWKDGYVSASYKNFSIRNIILRENYKMYKDLYHSVISRMRYYYSKKTVNHILFNAYLHTRGMPMLTPLDFVKMNKGPTYNKGSTAYSVAEYIFFSLGILILAIMLIRFMRFSKIELNKKMSNKNSKFPKKDSNGKNET